MSYAPPAGDEADFSWVGTSSYAPPDGDAADFAWEADVPQAQVDAGALFGDLLALGSQSRATIDAAPMFGELLATSRVYPPSAEDIPSGVTRYYCKLTGTPDLILPLSSFSVRHRVGSASYYSVVIPSYDFVSGIAARPLGQIVIWSDTDGVEEELSRGTLGDVRTDRGPRSQSITISGNSSQAALPRATYILTDALYAYSTFDGEQRLRIKPRAAIRPGDTVRYGSTFFEVGLVSWSVSSSGASMEVATVPPSDNVEDAPLTLPYLQPITLDEDEWTVLAFELPAGEYIATITGLAQAELYTRVDAEPTTEVYDCKKFVIDDPKACSATLTEAGTWHIGIYPYAAGTVTLSVSEVVAEGWPCDGDIYPPWVAFGTNAPTFVDGAIVITSGPGEFSGIETPVFAASGEVTVDVAFETTGSGATMAIGNDGEEGYSVAQGYTEMTFAIDAGSKFTVVAIGAGGTATVRIRAGTGTEHFGCA